MATGGNVGEWNRDIACTSASVPGAASIRRRTVIRWAWVILASGLAGCDGDPKLRRVTVFKGWDDVAYVEEDLPDSVLEDPLPADFDGWLFDFSEPIDSETFAESLTWLGPDGTALPLDFGMRWTTEMWAATPEIPVGFGQQLIFDGNVLDWAGKTVDGAFVVTFDVSPKTCDALAGCPW